MNNFVDLLRKEIQKGLPGSEIQWQMASSDRMLKDFPRIPGKDARVAAVLILLYPHNGSIYTLLMQRTDYDGNVMWGATAMILHELLTIIKNSNLKSLI